METLSNINFRARRDSGCSLLILFYMCVVPSYLIITLHADVYNGTDRTLCRNDSYYAQGGVFARNLETVFNSLVQNTPKTRFNTSVYGQSPDQIYGLLQCRGDLTFDQCYNCSQNATISIRQSCGNAVGGRIWLDAACYLRYNDSNFIGQIDKRGLVNYKPGNVSDPDVFNGALQSLLTNLSAEVTNVPSRNRYASGTTAANFFPRIYALVQCTRDISNDDCTTCLQYTIQKITLNYYGRNGVQYLLGSCIVSYQLYKFFNSTALTPPLAEAPGKTPVATPSTNSTKINDSDKSSKKISIILGVIVGGLLLPLALLVCFFTTRRRLKGYKVHEQIDEDTLVSEDRQILMFNIETLIAATENFHDDNKLGEGGFGPVYKGITHDGKEIAVKKLSLNSRQGKKEFLTEVKLVAQIQHRNLVKLLGCCAEGLQKLLVYEYLPNNSLDKILFMSFMDADPLRRTQLDWQKRYNIILGVARGLLYLHEDSQPRIIHRDIKASNILLDQNLNPKIADFGLAKLFPEDESYVSALTKVAGTPGYMAPEYAMHGQLSAKADVYSFGILLLEIVTGRRNTDYNLSPEMQVLLEWVWRSYEEGKSVEIIDPVALIESSDVEQALRCIEVGLWCTQADSSLRPAMSTVTLMLSSHSATLPELTKPVFANSHSVGRINRRYSSSGCGLSHASATTLSASTDLAPAAPPSIATVSSIELAAR